MSCSHPLLSSSQDYVNYLEHMSSDVFNNVRSPGAGSDLSWPKADGFSGCWERRGEGREEGQQVQPLWTLLISQDLTGGEFEDNLKSLHLQEGRDFVHFS